MDWTMEKVAALAADAGTEKRGKKLATTKKWHSYATDGRAVWGECKGSGSAPYYVKIDLQGPAFGCSCPVRKLPCKHIMGLFFLFAQENPFPKAEPPSWISQWITKRDNKGRSKTTTGKVKSAKELEKAHKAKARREAKRMELMAAGVDELEQWLLDLVRQGFANVDVNSPTFWEQAAFKMKDAKLSRLSYFLKETGEIASKRSDWMEEVAARIGESYLLVQAFKNYEQLGEAMQEEVMNALGRTVKKSDVLEEQEKVADHWLVLAKKEEVDLEGVQARRTWLLGLSTQRKALILDYAFGNMGFEQQYVVGSILDGELAYYPAAYEQRAVFQNAQLIDFVVEELPGSSTAISAFQEKFSHSLALNPWLLKQVVILQNVLPYKDEQDNYFIKDEQDQVLPLANLRARVIWKMLALSGGYPITVIGEWDGYHFEVLSLWKNYKIEEL